MNRLACLLALMAGCSDPSVLTIEVTIGHESDAFKKPPAVSRVEVAVQSADGTTVAAAEAEPGGSFDLGQFDLDQFASVEVRGYDSTAALRVRGRSIGVVLGSVAAEVLPVFAQRLDEWARPPGQLPRTHVGGVAGAVGERYLMLTGGRSVDGEQSGTDAHIAFYDLLALGGTLGGALGTSTMPRVAESLVVSADGDAALFIDAEAAIWVDFQAGNSVRVDPPAGLELAQVAGGRTVRGPDASYLVGATRSDAPSDRILIVGPDRSLRAVTLTAPRQGAAAAYVEGAGLVIAGGSASAPGAEVIAPEMLASVPRAFPPDPVQGAGAVGALGTHELVLVCGSDSAGAAPIRTLSLDCLAPCEATVLDVDLGAELTDCEAFTKPTGELLVMGSDRSDGLMRAFSVTIATAQSVELPLREPRRGARAIPTPLGTLAVLGGEHPDGSGAFTVELLFPE